MVAPRSGGPSPDPGFRPVVELCGGDLRGLFNLLNIGETLGSW